MEFFFCATIFKGVVGKCTDTNSINELIGLESETLPQHHVIKEGCFNILTGDTYIVQMSMLTSDIDRNMTDNEHSFTC